MVKEQPLRRGDDERRGLAGASFRAGNEVVIGQRERDDGRLNGTRILPAEIAGAFQQSMIQAERRKGNRRRVDIDRVQHRDAGRRRRARRVGVGRLAAASARTTTAAAAWTAVACPPVSCVRVQTVSG
jgi:hypothetical protein